MTALRNIIAETLFSTITNLPAIVALQDDLKQDGAWKVFLDNAPQNASFPYIVYNHLWGGREPGWKQYADTRIKVCATTGDQTKTVALAEALNELLNADYLLLPTGVCLQREVEEVAIVSDTRWVMNTMVYDVGGIYRFDFNLGAN